MRIPHSDPANTRIEHRIAGADANPYLVAAGLAAVSPAFGRAETLRIADREMSILLVKNPAGANEVLRTLRLEAADSELDLWIALNDRIADGRDISWIWDADFELLAGPGLWKVSSGAHTLWILGLVSPVPRKMDWYSPQADF